MNITLTKKLNASQRKKYIFENKTYDWESNYMKLIKEFVDAKFTYDIDNRQSLIDGEKFNDLMMDKLLKMFDKSGLEINNQNTIKKVVKSLCSENSFSEKQKNKEIKRQIKAQEKEQEEKQKQEERERKRQIKAQEKGQVFVNQFNEFRKFIKANFAKRLSYNINTGQVFFDNLKMTYKEQDNMAFQMKIATNCNLTLKKSEQYIIIEEIAKERKFEEKIVLDDTITCENLLDNYTNLTPENFSNYLARDGKGKLVHSIHNYALYLQFCPKYYGKIKKNLFTKNESVLRYDKIHDELVDCFIDDAEASLLKGNIEVDFNNGSVISSNFENALNHVLKNNEFNPVLDLLTDIRNKGWDGKHRMHDILIKYFGATDCFENREMTEVMLCGALQRVVEEKRNEGTMFDYMGIMFGKQGTGKTKFMTRLHLGDHLSSINPPIKDPQSFVDLTNRAWLVLFDEMTSIDKADMGEVKSRITEQGVNVRLSYGRRSNYYPRHNVFWGNTNYMAVLRDEGYERRFLCFECNKSEKESAEWWDKNYTDYDIEQIWAEVWEVYLEKWAGKKIQISPRTEEYNYKIQKKHKVWVEDVRTEMEITRILENTKFNKSLYLDEDVYEWECCIDKIHICRLDETKLPNNYKYPIDMIPFKWLQSKIMRKNFWIEGMIENNFSNWRIVEFSENDDTFKSGRYLIRKEVDIDKRRIEIQNERNYRNNKDEFENILPKLIENL